MECRRSTPWPEPALQDQDLPHERRPPARRGGAPDEEALERPDVDEARLREGRRAAQLPPESRRLLGDRSVEEGGDHRLLLTLEIERWESPRDQLADEPFRPAAAVQERRRRAVQELDERGVPVRV